jgi:tetratricopeptide (TPR) repeat protein
LAHLRRALVYGWTGGYGSPASLQAATAAIRFAGRLPPRNRRLLQGYFAFEKGSPGALDSLRAYVTEYPGDLEGWYTYGEALYHLREFVPSDPDTVMAAFDRVIQGDSTLTPALIHPLELTLVYRDSSRFARYLGLFERTAPPRHLAAHRVAAGFAWGPAPSDSALKAAIASVPYLGFNTLSSFYRDEAATSDSVLNRIYRLTNALPANAPARRFSPIGRGFTLIGLGRLREARTLVDTVAQLAPGAEAGLLGFPIMLGIAPRSSGGARLDSLMARPPEAGGGQREIAYREATRSVVLGKTEEAIRKASEGLRLPDATPDSTMTSALLKATIGWAELVRGDTARGIQDLRSGLSQSGRPNNNETAFLRLQLALALAADKDTRRDGISRLRFSFDNSGVYLLPLAYLALGRTYEAAGKPDSAALAYGRFIRLWDKADPELQGRVTEAREALSRLTAELR